MFAHCKSESVKEERPAEKPPAFENRTNYCLFSYSELFIFFLASTDLDRSVGLDLVLFENHLIVEFTHHLHFLSRGLRAFHLGFVRTREVDVVQHESVRFVGQLHFLTASENFVTAMFFVPLSDGRILVHVLDDIAPSDSGVICTERDLA